MNAGGRTVKMTSALAGTGTTITTDISQLPPGLYIIQVQEAERSFTAKFLKSN
jgi:hypothetical protein